MPRLEVPSVADADALYGAFIDWAADQGIELYPHQDQAVIEILTGAHAIVTTPTGSGKTLIAVAAHFASLASGGRSWYTAPIKALVSEKFFAYCEIFGTENVGMITGDASVNSGAPIICCTAEILANVALRNGHEASVDQVVMDEFHFIADPDRGWAWQVGLVELPQAQFVIMSATLGDVTELASDLGKRTGRPATVIGGATRPVPLAYSWVITPIHETVETLVRDGKAPVYIVHSTQLAAMERAQALLSANLVTQAQRRAILDALGHFRFSGGFGRTLAKLVHSGIGVHHAGMLPRYRRLVETLAQAGLLVAICGTDTLGVGINVPIRSVLFTGLTKFDGRRDRVLRAREFHQIAGRAGRAGFDTIGYVVAQAPDHVVENERALAKVGDDPKRRRGVPRKKPPEGFINYTEQTFERLIAAEPEALHARMRITHAMLLNLLQREADTADEVVRLVESCTSDPSVRRALLRRAAHIGRSLIDSGVVRRLAIPEPSGRRYALSLDLQDDFALNQPLSAFAMAALDLLDPESPDYPLDVVSIIESTLEDPRTVLVQQQFKARGEAVAELKADGYEYEERMELLSEVTWPQPQGELIEHAYRVFLPRHPWLVESPPSPKSIVRDLYERAMTFGEYVAFYKVQRSEGLVLRYLSDAFRALRQTVPESARTPEFTDLVEWLGEVVRLTDSSLLDEWEALTAGVEPADVLSAPAPVRPVTGNLRAFRVLVRNAMFRRVQLCAADDLDGLVDLERGDQASTMTRALWDAALEDFFDEHDVLPDGPDARSPAHFVVEETGRMWSVRQVIDDPAGNHDWSITATIDLDACDEAGELIVHTIAFARLD